MVLHKQEEAVDIRCGPHLVLLRTSQGRVLGWGQNKNDCLGESKPVFYRPQLLTHPALHDILSVAAGDGVCMFIRAKQGMDTNQEGRYSMKVRFRRNKLILLCQIHQHPLSGNDSFR